MTAKRFHWDWRTGRMKDTYSSFQATKDMRLIERQINDACRSYEKQIDKLEKENDELKKRNENQYRQLQHLWSLMEAKDWKTLSAMVNQMEEDEKRLQNEWKCYE